MRRWLVTGLIGWAGCSVSETFVCQSDLQCGEGGQCQSDGFCSGADGECPSGQRYFDHAGSVAGECVPQTEVEAGGSSSSSTSGAQSTTLTTSEPDVTSTSGVDDPTTGGSSSGPIETSEGSTGGPLVDPDLVAWYRMDEVTETGTLDSSANGLDASCVDATCPLAAMGLAGGGALFDGVDDVHVVAHDPLLELEDGFSVMGWGRFNGAPAGMFSHLVAKPFGAVSGNSFELFYRQDPMLNLVTFRAGPTTVSVPLVLDPDTWFHLAGTYDGQTVTLFVDGEPVLSRPELGPVNFDTADVLIGADADSGDLRNFFGGTIDDIRIYRRALTDQEIADVHAEDGA